MKQVTMLLVGRNERICLLKIGFNFQVYSIDLISMLIGLILPSN